MVRYFLLCALLLTCSLSVLSCDKGLAPIPEAPSIQGHVTFQGAWPPHDSAKLLTIVLIPGDQPYHVTSLIQGVVNKSIPYALLNYRNADTTYRMEVPSGYYGYLGIAEQFGDSIYRDWRSIGFAHDSKGDPRTFTFTQGTSYTDGDITVNFDSLPPQPFVP